MGSEGEPAPAVPAFDPKLIASTGELFQDFVVKKNQVPRQITNARNESNFIHSAQFSADGTTIITHNEDQCLRSFVLPHDLLEPSPEPKSLTPTSTFQFGSNVQSYALFPGFNLRDTSTTLALCASAGVPLSLRNVLQFDTIHATYPFVSETTEAHLAARSLVFTRQGTQFIAGGDNSIALFDCARNGSGPVNVRPLRRSRTARRLGHGVGVAECHGIVSTMSISNEGLLAVGTLARQIGLYDHEGSGECSAAFSIANPVGGKDSCDGTGITQVAWSPCSTYLCLAERQSDVVQVFDVRNTYQKLSTLTGRTARTTQRLGFDIVPTMSGFEVWAGDLDGKVSMWSNPAAKEGSIAPNFEFAAHQGNFPSKICFLFLVV